MFDGMRPLLVIADDLTGATEAAAAFAGTDHDTRVILSGEAPATLEVIAVSTRARTAGSDFARRAVSEVLDRYGPGRDIFVKVDSTLRGPVHAVVEAIREHARATVIVAPAAPHAGRVTIGGVQYADGQTLARHPTWAIEATPPPATVAAALGDLAACSLPLKAVRSQRATLIATLRGLHGDVVVVDAEAESDLAAVVAAGRASGDRICWVGAGGLARALAGPERPRTQQALPALLTHALIIVGSATSMAAAQIASYVRERRGLHCPVRADALANGSIRTDLPFVDDVRRALASTDVLISISGNVSSDRGRVAAGLADLLAPLIETHGLLVISGGETADRCLAASTTASLAVVAEVAPGVVLTQRLRGERAHGHLILKPGAFGAPDIFEQALGAIRSERLAT